MRAAYTLGRCLRDCEPLSHVLQVVLLWQKSLSLPLVQRIFGEALVSVLLCRHNDVEDTRCCSATPFNREDGRMHECAAMQCFVARVVVAIVAPMPAAAQQLAYPLSPSAAQGCHSCRQSHGASRGQLRA